MKRRISGWLGVGALLLAGCSGSICERMAEVARREKVKDCPAMTDNIALYEDFPLSESFRVDQCETFSQSCTDLDDEKLEAFLDCYDELGTCEEASQQEYLSDWNKCVLKSKDLSETCYLQ